MIGTNGSKTNGNASTKIVSARESKTEGSRLESDLIPRERRENGDIVARKIAYSHPITGGTDLDKMELSGFLDEVQIHDPLLAKHLRSVQQDRIRQLFERAGDVRRQEDSNLENLRQRSSDLDQKIDGVVAEITKARDETMAPYVNVVNETAEKLADAHDRTGGLFAQAGGVYDPENPNEESVLRVDRLADSEVAATLKVPYGDGIERHALLPKWFSWFGTVMCGITFGISLALASGVLQSQDVFVRPKPFALLAAALIGVGMAGLGRGWLRTAWHQFSESHWVGLSRIRQWAWFGGAIFTTLFVGAIIVATDRQGILKSATVNSAWDKGGVKTSELVFWIVAAAASVLYLGYAVYEGLARGRQDPIKNAIIATTEKDYRDRIETRRADPQFRDALNGLNSVFASNRRHQQAVARAAEISRPFDELIARAEDQRIPYPLEHTLPMKQRVQDPLHNLEGLQIEFDALVSDFLAGRERLKQ